MKEELKRREAENKLKIANLQSNTNNPINGPKPVIKTSSEGGKLTLTNVAAFKNVMPNQNKGKGRRGRPPKSMIGMPGQGSGMIRPPYQNMTGFPDNNLQFQPQHPLPKLKIISHRPNQSQGSNLISPNQLAQMQSNNQFPTKMTLPNQPTLMNANLQSSSQISPNSMISSFTKTNPQAVQLLQALARGLGYDLNTIQQHPDQLQNLTRLMEENLSLSRSGISSQSSSNSSSANNSQNSSIDKSAILNQTGQITKQTASQKLPDKFPGGQVQVGPSPAKKQKISEKVSKPSIDLSRQDSKTIERKRVDPYLVWGGIQDIFYHKNSKTLLILFVALSLLDSLFLEILT